MIEKTYKHKPVYLIAKEEGEVKGVLPLFQMRSWFFGNKLVSVPFAPYGRVCKRKEKIDMTKDSHKVKSDLEKMYDATASIYGEEYQNPAGYYFMWRKIRTVLDLGCFSKSDDLLEVGCANGPYTFEFARLGFKMTGLDLSTKNIEEANKRANINNINAKFIVGDAENLSIQDNTFEGIISLSTLRYVPNPQKAINEMYRVVQKGKNIAIDFPNKRSP